MRKKIAFVCSIFALLSCNCVLSEKLGIQKKKKNLEQDAMHILMKKLENLYRLSATDNSEVLNKEIESLKKQIDQLHQHGGVIEGENLGHLLESEAANESTKKTIFGVDEDDLDNYDVDFTGQSKGKIKGQTDPTPVAEPPAHNGAGDQESPAPPAPSVLVVPNQSGKEANVATLEAGYESADAEDEEETDSLSSDNESADSNEQTEEVPSVSGESAEGPQAGPAPDTGSQQAVPVPAPGSQQPGGGSGGTGGTEGAGGDQSGTLPSAEVQPAISPPAGDHPQPPTVTPEGTEESAVTPQPTSTATTPERTSNSNDVKIKYMDKLYDDILSTLGKTNEIHIPLYHSKYNTIRKDYELSMKPVEYQIVKNLFNVGFKKEGESSAANSLTEVFKKVLVDEKFQDEFNNFVHGLYGFAKRHNYLGKERLENTTSDSDLLKNAFSLMNTLEVN